MIRQTILPFKIEMTRDLITPHAGLALLGEVAVGLGVLTVSRQISTQAWQWCWVQAI